MTLRSTLFGFVLALAGCGGPTVPTSPAAEPAESTPSQPSEEPAAVPGPARPPATPQAHLFSLDDAKLFGASAVDDTDADRRRLIRAGARGVRIDAPFHVDATVQDTVPVIGFVAVEDASDASFDPNGWFVGVQQGVPGFQVARPAPSKMPADGGGKMPADGGGKMPADGGGKMPADAEPSPSSGGGGGVVSSPFSYDVRSVLGGLDWSDAAVRIYAVRGAHRSNGVTVSVSGGTGSTTPHEPDVISAAKGDSPGDEPLALDGPSVATTEPGGTVTVTGYVRGAGAMASVYLFATESGSAGPFENKLDVPLKDGVGTFSLNLLGENRLPKAPGTWHIYAFSGEHVAGPVTIELSPGAKPW